MVAYAGSNRKINLKSSYFNKLSISQDPCHQRSQMVSAVLALSPYSGIALASAALVAPHPPLNTGQTRTPSH